MRCWVAATGPLCCLVVLKSMATSPSTKFSLNIWPTWCCGVEALLRPNVLRTVAARAIPGTPPTLCSAHTHIVQFEQAWLTGRCEGTIPPTPCTKQARWWSRRRHEGTSGAKITNISSSVPQTNIGQCDYGTVGVTDAKARRCTSATQADSQMLPN